MHKTIRNQHLAKTTRLWLHHVQLCCTPLLYELKVVAGILEQLHWPANQKSATS